MTPEERAAYLNAQAAAALIEAMGMLAENRKRELDGEAPAYNESHFLGLIDRYGLHLRP